MTTDKNFGFFVFILAILLACYCWFVGEYFVSIFSFSLAICSLILAFHLPQVFKVPNILWDKIGFILGLITSPIIMGLIFYVVISPVSILTRLFGRDVLLIKRDVRIDSYWVLKENKIDDQIDFKRQY
jgi:hypothetical protein